MNVPLSRAAAKPKHVPKSAVYDFDMFRDPAYNRDPYKRAAELVREAPAVFWTPRNGGHWIVQGYQAAFDAARDHNCFSNEIIPYSTLKKVQSLQKGLSFIGIKTPRVPLPFPIMLDPPLHTQYRRPLLGVFSPKNVNTLEGRLRKSAQDLIDQVADQGRCEFMAAIAEPLPVQLFLQLLGLPVEKMPEYRALLKKHMAQSAQATSNLNKLATLKGIVDVMRSTLLERRENPQDDLISALWNTKINDKPVTLEDMENFGLLLFLGGLDTVMQAMGHAIRHLAMHPDLQQELRDHPERIDNAIDEILRRYTIATPPRRVNVTREFHGVNLKKNDVLFLFLNGANLDPNHFENPEQVDLDRADKVHIAFNSGPHRCLGSHLARLELRMLYEEILSRLPSFRLDPQSPPTFTCGYIIGVERLDLIWEA